MSILFRIAANPFILFFESTQIKLYNLSVRADKLNASRLPTILTAQTTSFCSDLKRTNEHGPYHSLYVAEGKMRRIFDMTVLVSRSCLHVKAVFSYCSSFSSSALVVLMVETLALALLNPSWTRTEFAYTQYISPWTELSNMCRLFGRGSMLHEDNI